MLDIVQKKRTYKYFIVNRPSPLTLEKNKAWHIKKKLNLNMEKGTKILKGTHNFFQHLGHPLVRQNHRSKL